MAIIGPAEAGTPNGGEMAEAPLELVMDVGRLPPGGDVKAPAAGSGPSFVTTNSRGPHGGKFPALICDTRQQQIREL